MTLEEKFVGMCVNRERRDIILKSLDIYLETLEKRQASRMLTQEVVRLKNEIDKMKVCQD